MSVNTPAIIGVSAVAAIGTGLLYWLFGKSPSSPSPSTLYSPSSSSNYSTPSPPLVGGNRTRRKKSKKRRKSTKRANPSV